jgi:hypothetical protein
MGGIALRHGLAALCEGLACLEADRPSKHNKKRPVKEQPMNNDRSAVPEEEPDWQAWLTPELAFRLGTEMIAWVNAHPGNELVNVTLTANAHGACSGWTIE